MSNKSITPIERILVLVFGVTTGATLYEFKVNFGFRLLWNKDIPWVMNGSVYLWPMNWLRNILSEVKAMATPGTIIASAMWGADVVHMEESERVAGEVLHYRSVPPEFANKLMADTGIPKHEWSRLMGHVHAEFFQMVFQDAFWREYTDVQSRYLQVIPLADWITAELSGQQGHDCVMLHDQGAGAPTSKLVNRYFDSGRSSDFAPVWRVFNPYEFLPLGKGAYVVPCTHDSLSRLVLVSTGLPWGLWTGSWYGVCHTIADGENVTPGEKTYNAGLVFEAMPNGLTAISHIGMDGPKWKALKNARGQMSYEDAARWALVKLQEAVRQQLVFPKELLEQEPNAFATAALTWCRDDLSLALAIMANTIAVYSKDGLAAAATALGTINPIRIAIVGGFAENPAILKALRYQGLIPVVPPFAGMATQAGMATRALQLSGTAKTIAEALTMLPNVVLPG